MAVFSSRMVEYTRKQTTQYLENTVTLYVNQINKSVYNVTRRMRAILLGTTTESLEAASCIDNIENSKNMALVYYSINQLKHILYDVEQEYGIHLNFFLYLGNEDEYIRLTDEYLTRRDYTAYEGSLISALRDDFGKPPTSLQDWRIFQTESRGYATYKLYRKSGLYMGCWIRTEDLVETLSEMDFGQDGFVVVSDESGNRLSGPPEGAPSGSMVITRDLGAIPCNVALHIKSYGILERVFNVQFLLNILLAATFICLVIGLYYAEKRLLKPIRNFSRNLKLLEEGYSHIDELSRNELQEFEEANAEFVKLLSEVERLKAVVYQQDAEKKTIQLDYLKIQIRPHFYLNCLNLINNMIDLGEYDRAMKMCAVTSDYMRYLFQNSNQYVAIEEEIRHVQDYIEIQQMQYGGGISFFTEIEDSVKNFRIPTLSIQTFVENSVKHGLTLERDFAVWVDIQEGPKDGFVIIVIRDNGEGFDKATLQHLREEGSVRGKDGHGVGIDNCLKRLYYSYGPMAQVTFENAIDGGAMVRIVLPPYITEER